MNAQDLPTSPDPLAILDPEIAEFVRRSNAVSAGLPRRDLLSPPEARRVALVARRQWYQGGPVMERIEDRLIPSRHGPLRARIYTPQALSGPGALLYLPGGGWVLLSVETHDRLMREYAEAMRLTVIGIDYSRAPEAKFPQAIEEMDEVIDWLGANCEDLGLDPARLAMGGDSAGANLTMASCLLRRDLGKWLPAAMVLNYGCFDMSLFKASFSQYGGGDYLLTSHSMVWFMTRYLRDAADMSDPLASPLRADLRGLPPAYMVITECDVLYDDNIAMAAALKAAGVEACDVLYPGTVHSFLEATSIAAIARRAVGETADWLGTWIG
jgi:acetyl esterase